MKKLLSHVAVLLLISQCRILADTTTTRFGLTKPDVGSVNWGPKLNTNADTIDNAAGITISNTFSSTNTFNSATTFNNQIQAASGTAISPIYSFGSEVGTGISKPLSGRLIFSITSSTAAEINASTVAITNALTANSGLIANTLTMSTAAIRNQILVSSGSTLGMNHRLFLQTFNNTLNFYTTIGTDPYSDPHIFQSFERAENDGSTQWIVGNSSNGYSVMSAKVAGSASGNLSSKLYGAGNGASGNWATGLPIANSGGLILSASTNSVVYSERGPLNFVTESGVGNIKFYPGTTHTIDMTPSGILFNTDGSTQTTAFVKPGSVISVFVASVTAATSGTQSVPEDDTPPQITEGTEFLSSTFTAKSSASLLDISAVVPLSAQNAGTVACSIFKIGTSNALSTAFIRAAAGNGYTIVVDAHIASAAGSQGITVRCGNSAGGTIQINSANASGREYGGSSLTIMKIKEVAQ